MFPHPCGAAFAQAVQNGADPRAVIPDEYVVVRGGTRPVPPLGQTFSATIGPTLEAAASAVPHGQVRRTTAGAIRRNGGVVEWAPEYSPHGTMNQQHVQVLESGVTTFSEPMPNPVPRKRRIDEGK
jgi:hypothetical protein